MANKLRIIFMGTPGFAVPSLKALLSGPDEVVAVVTQPDRPKGRGRKLARPPIKELALAAGLPLLQPTGIRGADFLRKLAAYSPDIIVVTAYGRILPGPLLAMPPLGAINVHGSLLPKYRGAAPIQWALINNETETGVTIIQMDQGLDTGDILLSARIDIAPEDTAGSLAPRLAELGGRTLLETLDLLRAGNLRPRQQNNDLATLAPLLSKKEGLVDWQQPAMAISGLIRGLDPWPTTYTYLNNKRLRLFAPKVVPAAPDTPAPGTLCRADKDGLLIATGQELLLVRAVQPEGRQRMAAAAFLRGRPLEPGTVFGR